MIAAMASMSDTVLAPLGPNIPPCLIGVALGLAVLVVLTCRKSTPLPGKLVPRGSFEHEDPANEEAIAERRRDFARILTAKRDLWHFTKSTRSAGQQLPIELSADEKILPEAGNIAYDRLRSWLQGQLQKSPEAVDHIANRIIYFISVSPGFEFMMKHRVPPMSLPAKYVLMISSSGQVRTAWYAFVTDKPTPGITSSPFIVRIVSEDLAAERGARTHLESSYTVTVSREKDLNKFISKHQSLIVSGIDKDAWDAYVRV